MIEAIGKWFVPIGVAAMVSFGFGFHQGKRQTIEQVKIILKQEIEKAGKGYIEL